MYLHRLLMQAPAGVQVDHINGDTLDNRRANLRLVSAMQNGQNRRRPKHNTSGVKGVAWHKGAQKWQVGLSFKGRRLHLGLFETLEAATRAYKDAARRMYGACARLE